MDFSSPVLLKGKGKSQPPPPPEDPHHKHSRNQRCNYFPLFLASLRSSHECPDECSRNGKGEHDGKHSQNLVGSLRAQHEVYILEDIDPLLGTSQGIPDHARAIVKVFIMHTQVSLAIALRLGIYFIDLLL